MNRELILEQTPLYEILDRLQRWYNLSIELPSPIYNSIKITGTFKKKSIEDILEAIGLMINLNVKREKNTVIFY